MATETGLIGSSEAMEKRLAELSVYPAGYLLGLRTGKPVDRPFYREATVMAKAREEKNRLSRINELEAELAKLQAANTALAEETRTLQSNLSAITEEVNGLRGEIRADTVSPVHQRGRHWADGGGNRTTRGNATLCSD